MSESIKNYPKDYEGHFPIIYILVFHKMLEFLQKYIIYFNTDFIAIKYVLK